ncbi:MAG: hypothetical protein WCP31_10650 [Chloroflexales bacterium]
MLTTSDNKGQEEVPVIYQATAMFAILLERAGLTQTQTATQAQVNRYHLAHVAAGRRNVSGAYAARIAAVYAVRLGIMQDEALAHLFVAVRERKNTTARPRGTTGRFVKTDGQSDSGETCGPALD